jgi:hypothetical protein
MKANKMTLMAVKKFLTEEKEYWAIDELKDDIVRQTNLLHMNEMKNNTLATDECYIQWGENEVCNLSDFVDSFTNVFLEKICNVLDSFIGDDISCYSEDEE